MTHDYWHVFDPPQITPNFEGVPLWSYIIALSLDPEL